MTSVKLVNPKKYSRNYSNEKSTKMYPFWTPYVSDFQPFILDMVPGASLGASSHANHAVWPTQSPSLPLCFRFLGRVGLLTDADTCADRRKDGTGLFLSSSVTRWRDLKPGRNRPVHRQDTTQCYHGVCSFSGAFMHVRAIRFHVSRRASTFAHSDMSQWWP